MGGDDGGTHTWVGCTLAITFKRGMSLQLVCAVNTYHPTSRGAAYRPLSLTEHVQAEVLMQ